MFRFDTRSDFDRLQRAINARKFYATLPHKLDQAEEDWLAQQPEPEPLAEIKEVGTFGEPGWSIQKSFKPLQKND